MSAYYSTQLRCELALRNREYANRMSLRACESYGDAPVICYLPSEDGKSHGNFLPESYRAIVNHAQWRKRLQKVHTSARTSLPRNGHTWRELDSSNSSDALLMNIFCFPATLKAAGLLRVLGVEANAEPEFGVRAKVPLSSGKFDRTELDMRLGRLLVEAKLTESDFQSREVAIVESYRDLAEVFEVSMLPRSEGRYLSYQLIRNVLAAHASDCEFCVMCDARRVDLREQWYMVLAAIRCAELRTRCKVITWQELAQVLPRKLRAFLNHKYGIVPSR